MSRRSRRRSRRRSLRTLQQQARQKRPRPRRTGWGRVLAPVDRVRAWARRSKYHEVVVQAAVLALVLGGALGAYFDWEWVHVRGWPVEQATVVHAERTHETDLCSRYDSEYVYVLTWISDDPPPGLPVMFTDREGCGARSVGDVEDVVRVVDDDGSVHVWVAPATSFGDVVLVSMVGLVGGLLVGLAVGLLRIAWKAMRWRRHR